MLFGKNKQTKEEKARAAEEAQREQEFQAKYTAKMKKKEVEKLIAEINKTEQNLIQRAAAAKQKGYGQIYTQCVTFIKVTRARKAQAEQFLFQMECMQDMQALSKNTAGLLGAMQEIAGSLGKLSLDKNVMMETQRNFAKTQSELDKQGMMFDQFLGSMEMALPDEVSDGGAADPMIDAEIDAFMLNGSLGSFSGASEKDVAPELASAEQLLKSLG